MPRPTRMPAVRLKSRQRSNPINAVNLIPGAQIIICLWLLQDRTWQKVKRSECWILMGIRGEDVQTQTEVWALLVYADHQPSKCNEGLMSLTGHGPKHCSRHGCLITVLTGLSVQCYSKMTNMSMLLLTHSKVAQAKPGGLLASSLPSMDSFQCFCSSTQRCFSQSLGLLNLSAFVGQYLLGSDEPTPNPGPGTDAWL